MMHLTSKMAYACEGALQSAMTLCVAFTMESLPVGRFCRVFNILDPKPFSLTERRGIDVLARMLVHSTGKSSLSLLIPYV